MPQQSSFINSGLEDGRKLLHRGFYFSSSSPQKALAHTRQPLLQIYVPDIDEHDPAFEIFHWAYATSLPRLNDHKNCGRDAALQFGRVQQGPGGTHRAI